MAWMLGQRKPSESLQMIQNWEDWLIISDGCAAVQGYWYCLENRLKFKKGQCTVLHLGRDNSRHL